MKILREDNEPIIKEALPTSFLTDMMSKGWEEVGYLKEASAAIKETYVNTTKVESLMQDLMDAYLVFIGQIELYLNEEKDIVATTGVESEPEPVHEPEANIKTETPTEEYAADESAPKPELPEADIELHALEEPSSEGALASEGDFDDFKITNSEVTAKATEEPFSFFVDFDEPDMSEPRLTDDDLYGHEDSELEQNKLKAQL
jgi:hypothetical protein